MTAAKKPILALAPMAGVSDSAFRQICRAQGADLVYTEMISVDGLFYDSKKTLALLKFDRREKPIIAQLFGKHPERFTKAAAICEKAGFDGIDINFGCPAKKVAGHGGGVTLMRDLPRCREIIKAVLAGAKLPVSVKIRSSINALPEAVGGRAAAGGNRTNIGRRTGVAAGAKKITALDFIRATKDLPLSMLMIHGRSYEKPFEGEPDYDMIKKTVAAFKKYHPKGKVLANGGIKTAADAAAMLKKTGADGLGLARGTYGRPWLFAQIKNAGQRKSALKRDVAADNFPATGEPSQAQIKKIILAHARAAFKDKGEHGLVELRKHLCWYVSGWPQAKEMRGRLVQIETLAELKKILAD